MVSTSLLVTILSLGSAWEDYPYRSARSALDPYERSVYNDLASRLQRSSLFGDRVQRMDLEQLLEIGQAVLSWFDSCGDADSCDGADATEKTAFDNWMEYCLKKKPEERSEDCKKWEDEVGDLGAGNNHITEEDLNEYMDYCLKPEHLQTPEWRERCGALAARAGAGAGRSAYSGGADRDVRDAWSRYMQARSAWEQSVSARDTFNRLARSEGVAPVARGDQECEAIGADEGACNLPGGKSGCLGGGVCRTIKETVKWLEEEERELQVALMSRSSFGSPRFVERNAPGARSSYLGFDW